MTKKVRLRALLQSLKIEGEEIPALKKQLSVIILERARARGAESVDELRKG